MDPLRVQVGFATDQGRRRLNEDYCAACESDGKRATREWVTAIADGLGGGPGGRLAAETMVRGFIDGYFGLPETLGVDGAAARAFTSMNRWICAQGQPG